MEKNIVEETAAGYIYKVGRKCYEVILTNDGHDFYLDSKFPLNEDGLSLAKARLLYKSKV